MAGLANAIMDLKVCRMIAGPRHETANAAHSCAYTLGSGGNTTGLGIVNRAGYDWALILAGRSQINSTARTIIRIGHQSGAATKFASATAITGGTLSMPSTGRKSASYEVLRLSLTGLKQYLNCKVTTCQTCGYPDVWCILGKGKDVPPSMGSAARVANI